MTNTPETDEAIRQLENIKASSIHTCHDKCQRPMCVLRRERDAAQEEIEMLGIRYAAAEMHHATNMQEVTDQRDRLATVLQRIRDGYGGQVAAPDCCEDCEFLIPIDAALQSLTPNADD